MRRSLLAMSISTVLLSSVYAQQVQPDPNQPPPLSGNASIPMTYVGSDGRVSLGVNDKGDVQGEALGVFGDNGQRAWIGQFWLGQGGAGGIQVDHNWLWGKTRQDSIDAPDSVVVAKSFLAVDQNQWHDRKATLGIGAEKQDLFLTGYVMGALTGQRFVNSSTSSVVNNLSGSDGTGNYTQTQTITTLIDYFERPYNYGVGLRGGKYFDDGSLRLHGGLDYEKGHIGADQATLSLGADKYIADTGFSFSLLGEHLKKSGPFETDKSDDRGWLFVRYDFGHESAFRAREPFKMVQVEKQVPTQAPPAAPQVIRNDVRLDTDAYFGFDQATLHPDTVRELDGMIAKLKSAARVSKVTVTGHTCNIGTADYNQKLSVRRAAAVRAYLIQHGIAADEIEARGEGLNNPKYPNDNEANRRQNRRVDVEFLTIEETIVPAAPVPATESQTEWVKEPVKMPAAWIERALRNPADHKRTVDVYKIQQQTVSTTLGPKVYAPKPPVAVDDNATLNNCAPVIVAVLANDSDPQGQTLTVTSVGNAGYGKATINAGGTVTYTPNAATGAVACTVPPVGQGDSFSYTIKDTAGLSATATVHLAPGPVTTTPPVAADDSATTPQNVAVNINVLANDSDPNSYPLSVATVTTPAHGTASINADNTIAYTPALDYSGADTFNYSISDGHGGTAMAKVSVTVTPAVVVNHPPVANDDSASTRGVAPVNITVLSNDTDQDGNTLSVASVTSPAHGSATINADGSVRYQAQANFFGSDTFNYSISDGHGGSASAKVTVTVIPDLPPLAGDFSTRVLKGSVTDIDVLSHASDPYSLPLSVIAVAHTGPLDAIVTINQNGTVRYQHLHGTQGYDTFTYTVSDGRGNTATATVTVFVAEIF